jgi:lysophospholipase L1-like esterase
VLGDSLSDPKAFGGGYLDYVRARCPKSNIENFAKGGFMVNQMRRRFETQVLTGTSQFSHLIVFGGVNDVYSDESAGRVPAKIQNDLMRIYTQARDRDMKIIAINIAPWGGYKKYFNPTRAEATRTVNMWINAQVAEGLVAQQLDAYALLSCGNAEMLCPEYQAPFKDGIHFGKKGHEVLGKALVEVAFKDCE